MLSTSVTLTNAQIKALPNTAVTMLADDASKLFIPVFVVFQADTTGGAYTNVDADFATLNVWYTGNYDTPLWAVDNNSSSTPVQSAMTALLTAGGKLDAIITQNQPGYTSGGGSISLTSYLLDGGIEGLGLEVAINNNIAGNLTGGNAANTLKVTLYYVEIAL